MSEAPDDRQTGQGDNAHIGRRSWGMSPDETGDDVDRRLHIAARAANDPDDATEDQPEDHTESAEQEPEGTAPGDQPVTHRMVDTRPTVVPRSNRPITLGDAEATDEADREQAPRPEVTSPTSANHSPASANLPPVRPESPERRVSAGDLIEQLTPAPPARSTRGWRGKLGMRPNQRELDELRDTELVKTSFRRPVTIMVANPKGGSGKTPTSMLLAAAMGQTRGGGVIAWDNNELRGTLPDRSISPHRRNVHDMLEALDQLRWSTSSFTDMAYFLNHQSNGNFYTLGSAQHAGQLVTGQNFRQVHELFCRYFQIIVVDTGNNEAAPNWTAAAGEADCLVVPTKWRKDSLIPAARMLESLQDTNPGLLERTVIAATNGPMDSQKQVKDKSASWFGSNHPIVDIPIDLHIAEGGVIDWAMLKPQTRRAALRLAAEVSERLIEGGHQL